jgi:hypothetical protein
MNKGSSVIEAVCGMIDRNDVESAKNILNKEYPFNYLKKDNRKYSIYQALKVFVRDGFIDRYSGKKLVFPGTLKLLSKMMPNEFPYHKNWKMDECHIAYWELAPTIDHVVPIARGGVDDESNWLTTSFLRNSAKANFTIEELDWIIVSGGNITNWDGMLSWFLVTIDNNQEFLNDKYINKWYRAAKRISNDVK